MDIGEKHRDKQSLISIQFQCKFFTLSNGMTYSSKIVDIKSFAVLVYRIFTNKKNVYFF